MTRKRNQMIKNQKRGSGSQKRKKKRYKMITNYQRGSGCARAQDGTELDGGRWSDPGPRLHIRALIYEYAKISVWYSIEIPWSILHQGLNLWVCKTFSLIFNWNSFSLIFYWFFVFDIHHALNLWLCINFSMIFNWIFFWLIYITSFTKEMVWYSIKNCADQ